jgi:hypothetical protein
LDKSLIGCPSEKQEYFQFQGRCFAFFSRRMINQLRVHTTYRFIATALMIMMLCGGILSAIKIVTPCKRLPLFLTQVRTVIPKLFAQENPIGIHKERDRQAAIKAPIDQVNQDPVRRLTRLDEIQ